jgi:hypothetical protein
MWLWLIVPWAGVVVWLLVGKRREMGVPFVELWRGRREVARGRREFTRPTAGVVAILLAVLIGILAAAHPEMLRGIERHVTVVADVGITMSAGRLESAIAELKAGIPAGTRVDLVTVPASPARWEGDVLSATCVDTSAQLPRAVAGALARTDDVVIVLTDQAVRDDPRVVRIAPAGAVANAAITRFAIRDDAGGKPQAMVTVRNNANWLRTRLVVNDVEQMIELPQHGQERSYFVDLPSVGRTAQAKIDVADDFQDDNSAYLARQAEHAAIQMRGNLSAEVRRVVDAYRLARPASGGARLVGVVAAADQLREDEAGIVAPSVDAGDAGSTGERPVVVSHPLTANLHPKFWHASASATPASGGWTAVMSSASRPVVLVREHPSRQVWIGAVSSNIAKSADFVVLWTNALDWVGAGSTETFAAVTVGTLGPEWASVDTQQPGIYRRDDGAAVAANAPVANFRSEASTAGWRGKLRALGESRSGRLELGSYLVVAAIGCALAGAFLWPGGSGR